jgi:putative acetyltransferase
MDMELDIREDDLAGPEIRELLREHLADMRAITPEGSVHAFDLDRLRGPDVTFWSARDGGRVIGCAALRHLDATSGEIKSMRTDAAWKRRGVASALLRHLLQVARGRGYEQVFLETGATEAFAAARALYARHGFEATGPFSDYRNDPHSHFMRLGL